MKAFYCDKSKTHVILNDSEIDFDESKNWKIIGYPGVDGIEFRMKAISKFQDVYAYYPIDDIHLKISSSLEELVKLWKENKLDL